MIKIESKGEKERESKVGLSKAKTDLEEADERWLKMMIITIIIVVILM